ncbi:MAG: GNAT family N-acetyltransferase [Desulfobacteraceae bacterium]
MIHIRLFRESDRAALWRLIEPVLRAGDTYAFSPDITEQEAFRVWVQVPSATFVAEDETGNLIGTYYIKANQPGSGSHVCNCGYIVSKNARNSGVASRMCDHSQAEAVSRGFKAMQYNLVVSTNEGAVRLWKKHGFEIAGRLAKAFRHPEYGLVDAFVMYKLLDG